MTMDREALVERVAEAIHARFVSLQVRPEDWPSWGELLAQGHQGMHRVNDTRDLARAALAVIEPVVREEYAVICDKLRHPNYSAETDDWISGTVACAAAIRAGAAP